MKIEAAGGDTGDTGDAAGDTGDTDDASGDTGGDTGDAAGDTGDTGDAAGDTGDTGAVTGDTGDVGETQVTTEDEKTDDPPAPDGQYKALTCSLTHYTFTYRCREGRMNALLKLFNLNLPAYLNIHIVVQTILL